MGLSPEKEKVEYYLIQKAITCLKLLNTSTATPISIHESSRRTGK